MASARGFHGATPPWGCQVEYLHFQGIIHRDIKPENLLVTRDMRLKLGDPRPPILPDLHTVFSSFRHPSGLAASGGPFLRPTPDTRHQPQPQCQCVAPFGAPRRSE